MSHRPPELDPWQLPLFRVGAAARPGEKHASVLSVTLSCCVPYNFVPRSPHLVGFVKSFSTLCLPITVFLSVGANSGGLSQGTTWNPRGSPALGVAPSEAAVRKMSHRLHGRLKSGHGFQKNHPKQDTKWTVPNDYNSAETRLPQDQHWKRRSRKDHCERRWE